MPSRVGALPHPSQKDHKKNGGRGSSGGAKPRHQGITMQDLKKQTALRLMAQQQQEELLYGYDPQGRGVGSKPSNNAGRVQPSFVQPMVNPTQSAQNNSSVNMRSAVPISRKPSGHRRPTDQESPKDDGSSSCTSGGSSAYSGNTPNKRGGPVNVLPVNNHRDQGRKLPHGLTVQELKELTAARLARESGGMPTEVAPSRRTNSARCRQPSQQQRNRGTGGSRNMHRLNASPFNPTSQSPFRHVGSSTPNRGDSPVSLPTFQGHAPSFAGTHQNILHPVPQNRYEQSPNALPGSQFQPLTSPRIDESPSRPEEVFPLRSRHWSIDSVSTLGSEYHTASDPKSPFPYRNTDGMVMSYSNGNMCTNLPSAPHIKDALGRALSRDRVLSQDRGSFESSNPHAMRHGKHGYEVLMSPNSAFSERSESRNQCLNSPFWAVDEEHPSNVEYESSLFGNSCIPPPSEDRVNRLYNSDYASLPGLDRFRHSDALADHRPQMYLDTLSMPGNTYGDNGSNQIIPPPMPRNQSESASIPNWVAESVLVTPQAENGRKIIGFKDTKPSGAAAWPESANKASDIFRPSNDASSVLPSSNLLTASTWTSPGPSSSVGFIGARGANPSSLSFGGIDSGIDSLAQGLGSILNLKPVVNKETSRTLTSSVFSTEDHSMFASLGQPTSSLEGHVSLSENVSSLSNAQTQTHDVNATSSKSSLWWGTGNKMFQE